MNYIQICSRRIAKYWRDPVWSKVISAFIVSLITLLYNYIISLINKTFFFTELKSFFFLKIELWLIILVFLTGYIGLCFFRKIISKKKNKFKYDNDTLNLDRVLFNKIRDSYMNADAIQLLAYNSISSRPFKLSEIDFIDKFLDDRINPNFEFINPYIEKFKQDFIDSIEKLNMCISDNIFSLNIPIATNDLWLSIPREWEWNSDRYQRAKNDLDQMQKDLYKKYNDFIREGRKILKI